MSLSLGPHWRKPQWFIIQEGEHAGKLHISGWMGTAIAEAPNITYHTGPAQGQIKEYHAVSHCPVCFAMVSSDDTDLAFGDLTWAHERWHHESETFPVPPELLERGEWA